MILLSDGSWEIKETQKKGPGLFAKKNITKSTVIGDYLGTIIHPQDALVDEENFYLMYYHDSAVITPDRNKPGVHLLNHSCMPNIFLYIYKGHTLAFALREIANGEELTIHYLLAPKDTCYNPCPHICHCESFNCTQTMHLAKDKYDTWRTITETQSKETKRERIRYNKALPQLSSYPKKIPNKYIQEITALFQR